NTNPDLANRLFKNEKMTFKYLLQKLDEKEKFAANARLSYDEYRDKLTTSLKYIETKDRMINRSATKSVKDVNKKINDLNEKIENGDALKQLIKERKKQLTDAAI